MSSYFGGEISRFSEALPKLNFLWFWPSESLTTRYLEKAKNIIEISKQDFSSCYLLSRDLKNRDFVIKTMTWEAGNFVTSLVFILFVDNVSTAYFSNIICCLFSVLMPLFQIERYLGCAFSCRNMAPHTPSQLLR
jgi:hypothetical protein